MNDFGPLLTRLREERCLSQCELGRRTGLHHSALSRLERGLRRPHRETIATLVRVLDEAAPLLPEDEATLWFAAGRIPPGVDVAIMRALLVASR